METEAELCWNCHDRNGISEWGSDDVPLNNSATIPNNGSDYNYGELSNSNWETAIWYSAYDDRTSFTGATHGTYSDGSFNYKSGAIQSTHTSNDGFGSSALNGGGSDYNYTESPDPVGEIRCSNCHDVHDLNKADGDKMNGAPYLRGSWMRNPYPEDGAPWGKAYTTVVTAFGPVPRAGGNEMGGFQIDQNNNFPTAGESLSTTAGLCTLCHGSVVEDLDKELGEGLWLGAGNGHSNAALGGTALEATNIFGDLAYGRPSFVNAGGKSSQNSGDVFMMGLQGHAQFILGGGADDYGYAYRNINGTNGMTPGVADKPRAYTLFTWGVNVADTGFLDTGYHAFSCSKCHNPHASRLPKLLLTNCLDTRHNTWQSTAAGQGNQTQDWWTSTADNGEKAATWNTAQNCHRYDPIDGVGGWNKVTPW